MATTSKLVELFNALADASLTEATATAFVEAAYENLLGLSGDFSNKDARVAYWVAQIEGGVSRADFASTFLAAAAVQGDLLTDAEFAANGVVLTALEALDETDLTLESVKAAAVAAAEEAAEEEEEEANAGETFTLTTETDSLVGTSKNDTFDASTSGTLTAGDVIVDSSVTDSDTLNATVTVNTLNNVVTNVENLNIAGKFTTTGFDFANTSAAQTATFSGGIANTTATVAGVKASKVAKIVAGENVKTLSITNDATDGTSGQVTVDAGSASTVTFAASAGADDDVNILLNGDVTVTNTTSQVENVTLTANAASAVTMDLIGTALTVAGDNAVTLTSSGLDGETVTNSNTAGLTVVNTDTNDADLSKVQADLIKTGALGANTLTVANGANLEVTADLGDATSAITAAAATATTNTVDVKFSTVASQTGVVFSNIKTANVEAAAPSITGTDLDFAILNNGTNNVVLTGENDVVVQAGTAKSFDASALEGKLTYTQAGNVVTTVKGGTGLATVVFAGEAVNSTFVGQDAGSSVTAINTTGVATITSGSGNDVVSATGVIAGAGTLSAELGDGANSVTANSATSGTINVVTGSGDDIVSATSLTTGTLSAQLGDGADSVTATSVSSGVVSLDLGAGDDSVTFGANTITSGTIVIDGGEGTDTLTVGAGTTFAAATLSLTDVDVIALSTAGTMTFTAAQISGKDYTIKGTATDNTDVLAVTAASATAATVIDLSTLTLDNSLTKAIQDTSITGSDYADTITGTSQADAVAGGLGQDTYIFAASGAANGADTFSDFVEGSGGDIFDVSAFLAGATVEVNGGTSGAITAFSSAATADAAIEGKVVLLTGTVTDVDETSEIAGLIDGTGDTFSIAAGGKSVVIAGSGVGTDNGYVYFVNDANGDGDVADTNEVYLVGTVSNFDTDLLTTANLVA